MDRVSEAGTKTMAKMQKTVMVPEDLYRLLQSCEKQSGASFTRITVAALLQYLFTRSEGPDPLWMEYAVSLELGEIGVGDMPKQRMQEAVADGAGDVGSSRITETGKAKEVDSHARRRWSQWRKITRRPGDDDVQKIIDHWGEQR